MNFYGEHSDDTPQSSEVILQLYGGIDMPHGERVAFPSGSPDVDFDRVYTIDMRLIIDWRRYF